MIAKRDQGMRTDRKSGPDFIIIGAQRSGTTWLHRVLESHPAVWVPPIKELHYFDDPTNKRYYVHLRKRLKSNLALRRFATAWDVRYFLGRRNDEWYRNLFEPGRRRGKVTGEATPAYAVMGGDGFERIKAVNPDVKLIFVMRDPIERMWSAIMNGAMNKRKDGTVHLKRGEESDHLRKSRYMNTINLLERHFPAEQLFFGFFDDIKRRPAELASDVLRFLGVEPGNVNALLPKRAVNAATGSSKPPADYEREMAAAHLPWLRDMCQRFPGPPEAWRDRYEALLKQPSPGAPDGARPGREVSA